MEKKPMCLSREEQDSLRALAGTADETVELSQSLYRAVVSGNPPAPTPEAAAVLMADETPTRAALKSAPVPVFAEDETIHKT